MSPNPARNALSRRQTLKALGATVATVSISSTASLASDEGASDSSSNTPTDELTESSTVPKVTIDDQSPHFGTVYVSDVAVPDTAFVAIHDASSFLEGPVLGVSAPLEAGTYPHLPVSLETYPADELSVAAIVHKDAPSDGVFTYPDSGDRPFIDDDGLVHDTARLAPDQ